MRPIVRLKLEPGHIIPLDIYPFDTVKTLKLQLYVLNFPKTCETIMKFPLELVGLVSSFLELKTAVLVLRIKGWQSIATADGNDDSNVVF